MAVLKILIVFLLIGMEEILVTCQVSEEYDYYTDESPERTEPNPSKMSPDNELTHVRTKNLSGNVKLTTFQVLTTNTPLDKLNNEFENEEVNILDEVTDVMGTWNENKRDEVQTVPENQQNVALLSEVRTKAPTDGMESFGLMDVFNGTSGTLPDQAGTEKLITVTPLDFELIHEASNSTSINLPEKYDMENAGLHDESEKIFGANSTRTADSENFTEKGTTAEVTFIEGISTSTTTDNTGRSTVLLDESVNEKSSTFMTTDFMTTQRYSEESRSTNKIEEMETSSTGQQPTIMTDLYQYPSERVDSSNGDAFTASISDPSMTTQIPAENNTHERITNAHFENKYLVTESEKTTTEQIRPKLNGSNLDQSREDIENLSSFIDVDEELLKSVLDGNEESINLDETIEDVSMLLNNYDEEINDEETASVTGENSFQFSATGVLSTEQNNELSYRTEEIFTVTENVNYESSIRTTENTTTFDSNNPEQQTIAAPVTTFLKEQPALGMFEFSSTPFATEEFTFSNSELNEKTTTDNNQNLLHLDEFTTVVNNIVNTKTFAKSESTLTEWPIFNIINEEERMDNPQETTMETISETTTNSDLFVETSSGDYKKSSTTFSEMGSTEASTIKDFQETHDTTAHTTDNSRYSNEETDFIITSNYVVVKSITMDTDTSSPSYKTLSTINDLKILRNSKELTLIDESSTENNEFSTVQTEQSTIDGDGSTPVTFSTTGRPDFSIEEESIPKTDLAVSDSVITENGFFIDVDDLEFETTMKKTSTENNINEFSTINTVTNGEDNLPNDTTVPPITVTEIDISKEHTEFSTSDMPYSTTTIRTSTGNNEYHFSTTPESTTTYDAESTTTTISYEERLKEDLVKLVSTGLRSFFETLVDTTAYQIETSLSANDYEEPKGTDIVIYEKEVPILVHTSEDDSISTTAVYSTFKESTEVINEDLDFEETSDENLVNGKFDKIVEQITSSWKLEKENFVTPSMYVGEEVTKIRETSKLEAPFNETFFDNDEEYFTSRTTTITQNIKMSTIVDSLINTVDEKQEFHLTTSEKVKMEEAEPQVTAKMYGRTLYFSIKITDNETTFFVPSDAFLTVQFPNTVNITWKSATTNMNNSLQLTLGNSVQLNLVKGTQMHIYKSPLILEPENKLDVDTNLITMDDGIQIYFSNTEFLKKDQENQNAFTADALPSVPTQTEVLAAEIVGGCIGVVVIATILIYWTIKKYKTKTRNFKPNSSA